jgi:hypothetical protein
MGGKFKDLVKFINDDTEAKSIVSTYLIEGLNDQIVPKGNPDEYAYKTLIELGFLTITKSDMDVNIYSLSKKYKKNEDLRNKLIEESELKKKGAN